MSGGGPRLRAIALALIARPDGSAVLASQGYDATKDQHFHRLLGGGIDFGETGEQAVVRELAEEIGVAITVTRFAGVIENIYTYQGRPGHELVLVYEARFDDPAQYARERFDGIEDDPVNAVWHPLVGAGSERPLYPRDALDLLGS